MLRAAIVFFCLFCATAATAAERVALIIGNGAYREAGKLKNPANDANAIAKSLERLGFKVVLGVDLTLSQMRQSLYDFAQIAAGAEMALFYYAGHGVQVDGRNYLLPTDAKLKREIDLDFATIEMDLILKQMNRAAKTRVIILDACRDNPFAAELARSMGVSRAPALGRGLAEIKASGGTMIAFATDPGAVAYDGTGDHSPFTEALLAHLETPGLELNSLMQRVRTDVYRNTGEKQRPWTTTSVIGEIYLAKPEEPEAETDPEPTAETEAETVVAEKVPDVETPQVVRSDSALEIAVWQAAEAGGTVADYRAYLDSFPEGAFSGLAKTRIDRLSRAGRATTTDPAPATLPSREPRGGTEFTENALGLSKTDRREVQRRLKLYGHDPRGVDGIFGAGSRAAISDWQKRSGYPITGFLDGKQLRDLKAQTADAYAKWKAAEAARRRAAEATRKLYRASAYCSRTGVTGYGRAYSRSKAISNAVQNCVNRGGIRECCANTARTTN